MSQSDQVNTFIERADTLLDKQETFEVNSKATIDSQITRVDSAIKDLSVLGEGHGSLAMNVVKGRLLNLNGTGFFANAVRQNNHTGAGYLHIGFEGDPSVLDIMVHLKIRGHNYGSNKINDETIVAYLYRLNGGIVYNQRTTINGDMSPFIYKSKGRNKYYLRLYVSSQYFNTIAIDAMCASSSDVSSIEFSGCHITPTTTAQV